MNVAIMGAGLSGLCCAIILERNGIVPTIFESRNRIGDRFVNAEVMLGILERPVIDHVAFLGDQYGIYLQLAPLRQLTLHSQTQKGSLRGNLGYITIRGRHENSLEMQLARQYKGKIHFNSQATYHDLQKAFTHVILATGDAAYTTQLQDAPYDLTVTLKGVTVTGEFNPQEVHVWLNNRYAPQGYGYLIPYSAHEANLVLGYPDYTINRRRSLEHMWQQYLHEVRRELRQSLPVTDQFEITRYIISKARYPRIGNTFLAGNCLCSPMPALGFGQFAAMLSGIYAAQHLLGQGNYTALSQPLLRSYDQSLVWRRLLERMNNRDYDRWVRLTTTPLANRLLNSRIDCVSLTASLLKPWMPLLNLLSPPRRNKFRIRH